MKKNVFILLVLVSDLFFGQQKQLQEVKEVTDIGNTTNNSVFINKGTSTFTGFESAFFVGQNENILGTTAANFTDNNRLISNALDWTFAKMNRSTFSGNNPISGIVGAYQIANNSGNGNALAVYANRLKAEHTGTGNTNFLRWVLKISFFSFLKKKNPFLSF